MQPRCENYAVAACRYCVDNLFEIVIHIEFDLLKTVCRIAVFLEKYADFVKCKVVFNPSYALVACFKLAEIVKCFRVNAYNSRHHCACVNYLFRNNRSYPARCARINVSVADLNCACAYADKRCVTAAAVNSRAGSQTKFFCGFFRNFADFFGALLNRSKVFHFNSDHVAYRLAPSLVTLSCVVKECAESRVLSHNKFAACTENEIFFNVEPFVNLFEVLRLVSLNPSVFPNRVFNR